MGTIKLQNIRTFSYHGCLIEEGKIGSDYSVDLEIKTDLRKSSQTDELADTVDYVLLNKIVVEEMAIRSKLLEHVAQRIITRCFAEIPSISRIKLAVSKLNPPIGGDVEAEVGRVLDRRVAQADAVDAALQCMCIRQR